MHTNNINDTKDRRRRYLLPVLLGLIAFGAMLASAASLGGVTSDNLGADVGVVASCDTDGVTVSFTTSYDAGSGEYVVSDVSVDGINAACVGQTMTVTLKDAAGVSLGSGSVAVAGSPQSVAMAGTPQADAVEGVAIVIAG